MKTQVVLALILAASVTVAQKKPSIIQRVLHRHQTATRTTMSPSPMSQRGQVSFTGLTKGTPSGRTFTLATRKSTYTVDTSKSPIRYHGRFFPIAKLVGGSSVTVKGHLTGNILHANDVTVNFARGEARPMIRKPMIGHHMVPKKH